jgi:hypothetical protein
LITKYSLLIVQLTKCDDASTPSEDTILCCDAGILEPIRADIRDAKLGVGKQEEDDFFTSEENVQRKKLNIELEETEEHIKKREVCNLTPGGASFCTFFKLFSFPWVDA